MESVWLLKSLRNSGIFFSYFVATLVRAGFWFLTGRLTKLVTGRLS